MNQFAPQITETEPMKSAAKKRLRRPYRWTALLIFIGLFFLCLLDGQVFTNRLIFLGCVAASGALWIRFIKRSPDPGIQLGVFLVLMLHVLILSLFSNGLPDLYRWQKRFNDRSHDIKQRIPEISVESTATDQRNRSRSN